ncbi:hypothetical protein CCR75_000874 [Bremia lactucae]|uniref:RxLR effector protein n=1 Tax=Bremia lactucae TaxID=4779 RepID=A0A976IFM9_BRELC|nr:hypothetical protein CCR75_000874 [Bremia lactucae]
MLPSTLLVTTVVCFLFVATSATVSTSDSKAFRSDPDADSGERHLADSAENTEERSWFPNIFRRPMKDVVDYEKANAALVGLANNKNNNAKIKAQLNKIINEQGQHHLTSLLQDRAFIKVLTRIQNKRYLSKDDSAMLEKVLTKFLNKIERGK